MGAVVSETIAFASTNLDDIFILMMLFSQRNFKFRNHHIVIGQYLGIAILTILSIIVVPVMPSVMGVAVYDSYVNTVENNKLFKSEQRKFLTKQYQQYRVKIPALVDEVR
ncbi:cadmium resistance transporter [Alkalihalobacillus deserti]|uniref:cadmium resistance transporter n=1 Tax=Alkalihalobacillus deserti TaxID=2879466 RepID=UPI001D138252|nr:cadmium resistance transporter [Alkalihalobacillus deserti]